MEQKTPTEIDITGLDKLRVLRALWEHSKPASFFQHMPQNIIPKFSIHEAQDLLLYGYVDYCCGRLIKTNFKTNMLNPAMYDREFGFGSMQKIIDELKKNT